MNVLGLNAYHGDVSAVLVRDGVLVAAVEEERFRRIKHIAGFPTEAIRACLRMAGASGRDIARAAACSAIAPRTTGALTRFRPPWRKPWASSPARNRLASTGSSIIRH